MTTQTMTETLVARLKLPDPKVRRAIRCTAGVSRALAAEACGVSAETLRSWEIGTREPADRNVAAYYELLRTLAATGSPLTDG